MPAVINRWMRASCRKFPEASPGREKSFPHVMGTLEERNRNDDELPLDRVAEILFLRPFGLPAQHLFNRFGHAHRPGCRLAIVKDTEKM
jgi:hypothetical protein